MRKKIIYMTFLMVVFSFTTLQAAEIQELRLEDAIIKAQKRDKKLRMQQTNINYAKVNTEGAKEQYDNTWDYGLEKASADYSLARIKQEYETKNEEVIAEQVAYDIERQFDEILNFEEQYEWESKNLQVQKIKVNQATTREGLGLGSKLVSQSEKNKLEAQNKKIAGLTQSIDAAYRKLNDAIGGQDERYKLIKENTYTPLDMKRSLQGQVSYAINEDLNLWSQEESAKAQEISLLAPGKDGYAPTYTEYMQRKLSMEQAMNNVSLSKEGKEEYVKQIYENILALEIQHDKLLIDLEEAQMQYEAIAKRHELGMVADLTLQEAELVLLNYEIQLSNIIRQHNQLKTVFDKSYLTLS